MYFFPVQMLFIKYNSVARSDAIVPIPMICHKLIILNIMYLCATCVLNYDNNILLFFPFDTLMYTP